MKRDDWMRAALWASAAFNVGGALLFVFPGSLGRLAGLPEGAPPVHRALVVLFILLFAGMYAWLARRPVIDRPMVGLAAIGKAGAFAVVFVLALFGQASSLTAIAFGGDLLLALVFFWWLFG